MCLWQMTGDAGTHELTHKSTTLTDIHTHYLPVTSYHLSCNTYETDFATQTEAFWMLFVGPRTACPSLTGSEVQTVELSTSCWMEAPREWAKYNWWVGSHHTELPAILQQNTEPSILSQVTSLCCISMQPTDVTAGCGNCLWVRAMLIAPSRSEIKTWNGPGMA
jgi:hypothetical protein